MKIDIENILYIIVIIVWVIVGFIKKSKKKAGVPTTAMPPMGDSQQPDISEMLEEILGKKPPEPPVKKPIPTPPQKEKKKNIPVESLETITGTDSTQRSIKKSKPISPLETESTRFQKVRKSISPSKEHGVLRTQREEKAAIEEENSSTMEEGHSDAAGLDLRKAIIYSEILKSPYL